MPSVHVAGVHPEEICARRARPAGSASVVASVAARLTPRTAPHRTIEPETRNREARTRFPDRHGARREMRVHLAFMGAERAVSVCYDTMPPDAGRVTAASYVGRCEARAARPPGAPREPPRFEPQRPSGSTARVRRVNGPGSAPRGCRSRSAGSTLWMLLDLSGGAPGARVGRLRFPAVLASSA